MKRILTIDGGGSRGLFAIQILRKIEQELKPQGETLNSYFHLIAGTSTGAIIAALIRRGLSLDAIEDFYFKDIPNIFKGVFHLRYRFSSKPLEKSLKEVFGAPPKEKVGTPIWEPGQSFKDWALGSNTMLNPPGCDGPRYLMLVMMRADTMSPWVLTNHPGAKYNDQSRFDCNLQIPLWRLVKGSAAAPFYFAPQLVWLPRHPRAESKPFGKNHYFVDGGVSSYNNPAFIAYRMATLAQHPFQWETGDDKLLLVSVGTGDFHQNAKRPRPDKLHIADAAKHAMTYLMSASSVEQDYLARINGKMLTGPSQHGNGSSFPAGSIDSEIGDLAVAPNGPAKFSYIRYQHVVPGKDLEGWKRKGFNVTFTTRQAESLKIFKELGEKYASEWVSPDHLLLGTAEKRNLTHTETDQNGELDGNQSLLKKVNEAKSWFSAEKIAPVWAKQNEAEKTVASLEGNTISYEGDLICRGPEGEVWAQGAEKFNAKYSPTEEIDQEGFRKYLPIPATSKVLAAKIDHPFEIVSDRGKLSGVAGDFVIKSSEDKDTEFPNSIWIVASDIFEKTYRRLVNE